MTTDAMHTGVFIGNGGEHMCFCVNNSSLPYTIACPRAPDTVVIKKTIGTHPKLP